MNQLVMKHEGFRNLCYADIVGVPTIGYGHTKGLKKSDIGKLWITKERGLELFEEDIKPLEKLVTTRYPKLNINRQTAIVSFLFNLGEGALYGKTTQIDKWLKKGNYFYAAGGMLYYNKAGGRVVDALVARRCDEASRLIRG